MDINSFLEAEIGCVQPRSMAHLPPMPELRPIRRPLVKKVSKAKREAMQPAQGMRPAEEPRFVEATSAASTEVPDAPVLLASKDQTAPSSHERLQQPTVPLKVSHHPPAPYDRLQQPTVPLKGSDHPPPPYDRLQQPPVPLKVSDHPPPLYDRLQQPPVPLKGSHHPPPPYDRLQQPPVPLKVSHHPPAPYDILQQPPVPLKGSDHPPPPYDRLQQPPVPLKVSHHAPAPYDRLRPQAPVPPIQSRPKAQVLPMASNSPSREKFQQPPALLRVPGPLEPSELSQCPRKVSAQTQSSHVWSQQPRDSNLQMPVPSTLSSPQPPVPSARSQQVSVSKPHSPTPGNRLHQSPALSNDWSQHLQVLKKVSGPQMPVLPRVTNPQVSVLSSVSDPQALSRSKRFQQPPELLSECQQVSPGHPDPPVLSFQCVVNELQKISDSQVPSSHESLKYSPVMSKTPSESIAAIASGKSKKSNFISQPRAPYFDNATKQNQPSLHHDLMQKAFLKQQYFQSNYVMQQAVQQYYHQRNQSLEQAYQKLNHQPPNQPTLSNIYDHRRQDSSVQSFPQLTSGYHRDAAVPCSVSECRTCMYYMKMTQLYGQKKYIPTEVHQHILQHGQTSYCQPWHNQYNDLQEKMYMYKYQQQMQHKMQNKLHIPPNEMECVQREQQLTYDHGINERTQPFLEKPMQNAVEQIQQPQTQQKHPTREQQGNNKPLMQTDSERCQQLRDQQLPCRRWHINPFFQQRNDAQQNIDTVVKEADAMLTTQTKVGQKESLWQTPDHCIDNPKNLVFQASHESVEIYSQFSKVGVTNYSIATAEAEQISDKITNSPTFAQTATINVTCQLSPPATPTDLRKVKEHKTDEYPCLQSSVKADPEMVDDQRLYKMSYELLHNDSPQRAMLKSKSLSNTEHEICNEYTSSTQNNAVLLDQAEKEHNLVAGHMSGAVLPPKGLSIPSRPSQIPTIFSPTPPPTPPEELFPEWNKMVTDNQRKRAVIENDIQECAITSTQFADDVTEKHSIESSAIPQTEISNQSICPPTNCSQPIHVVSQQVSRKQEKKPKIHTNQDLSGTHVISNERSPLLLENVSQSASVISSEKYFAENCFRVQQKDIVITEREQKTNKKTAKKSNLHLNIPLPENQLLPSQQKSLLPKEPSTSITETLIEVCGTKSLSSMQNEMSHYSTKPSCIINGSVDSQNVSNDTRTIQQAISKKEKVVTDVKILMDGKSQTLDIAGPPKENSHRFAKQGTTSVGDGIPNTISKYSVVSVKQKLKTVSKNNIERSSNMYDCLGSVHFISRCYRTMCFVCNKEISGKNVINHMFFPHLKCRDCKTIIKSCQAYSQLKKRLRKGKLNSCSSVSGCHNFDRWNVNPVDFLAYKIRKFIALREKRSYNNQPTEQEVTDEMEKYIKKLSMLQFLNPWKSAIRSCKTYMKAVKQTKSKSKKEGKKRKRAEDPEKGNGEVKRARKNNINVPKPILKNLSKTSFSSSNFHVEDPKKENGEVKRARKKSNINVPKPVLKNLSETSNTSSNFQESCSQITMSLESTNLDKTTNRSEETIVLQEQGKTVATTERTVHKVPSIITKVIQEPLLAKVNGEPQAKELESSVDAALPEYGDEYLLNSCDMDMLDKMTTYVSLSDGP
ncbi:uncharacterized protein LOC119598712 [Penaeus monodon]|uniref:uncharacterized protein LOC119598712 n=1 Tax=Penaeus monodon TaxID=6687 RepID=UPI0018A7882B|nr:uncharacterized protein LOC119598712 [Penaeus monodon]